MSQKRSNVHLFTSFSFIVLTVVLGLWLNTNTAHAVVTNNPLDAKLAPASVCYIEMWNSDSNDENTPFSTPSTACSGTLISDNRVLTAAHCIPAIRDAEKTQVTCGNGIFSSIKGFAADPDYQNLGNAGDTHDVSVLDLESPQKPGSKHYITPMPLASTQAQIATILMTPTNCTLWGYGRNDASTDDNSWGTLRGASVDDYITPQALQARTGWLNPPQDIYIGSDTHAAPGDSGGPIVCQAADGSLVQIATTMIEGQTTAGQEFTYSVHEMTYFNTDWINSQIALDHLPNN
jgi:V8-like Glu-specific endopeptidase